LPTKPGDLCAIDFYGPLPFGRLGFRYIFVCFDVFSKFVKLYPLKAATTKACLNKIVNDYVVKVTGLKCILNDNGTRFASKIRKSKLAKMNIDVMFYQTADGTTKKFARPYDGPWKVTRVINPTTYKVADKQGNNKIFKPKSN
jgi:hypothetical protein